MDLIGAINATEEIDRFFQDLLKPLWIQQVFSRGCRTISVALYRLSNAENMLISLWTRRFANVTSPLPKLITLCFIINSPRIGYTIRLLSVPHTSGCWWSHGHHRLRRNDHMHVTPALSLDLRRPACLPILQPNFLCADHSLRLRSMRTACAQLCRSRFVRDPPIWIH